VKDVGAMFDWFYVADFIVLIAGAVEVCAWLGQRSRRIDDDAPDIATLTGATLGGVLIRPGQSDL
jgi:hypothetical protein